MAWILKRDAIAAALLALGYREATGYPHDTFGATYYHKIAETDDWRTDGATCELRLGRNGGLSWMIRGVNEGHRPVSASINSALHDAGMFIYLHGSLPRTMRRRIEGLLP